MRSDISIYNEATAFVITSKNVGGVDFGEIEDGSPEWRQAVADGILLPVSLVQDDAIELRVVVIRDSVVI